MARRFSQIKRGAEYNKGLDNYVQYLRDSETRPTKRLQGGVRGTRRVLLIRAVTPFGMTLSAGEVYQVRASQDSITGIGSAVGTTRLITPAPTADLNINKKFKPARVSAFRGSGTASYVQSKVTKLFYLKYEGDSFSLPFGALNETEEEADGARAVRVAVLSVFGSADIKRVSFSPERVPV
ncbi:hypothetical protein [Myxacorys almedinensis]|uniref:Uncharacterized protein n=1 Tax=Myxacorys almedinensis A TaxID=2690445 RepID=A0A8J7Z5H0_9CYAN|nr:hypothetical protein [Myxacorys almedinensis]NDJ16783.1 hypothetical protein [Myxacorys almedinensis A]